MAEMQCVVQGESEHTFYYQFDKNDYLQVIYQRTFEAKNVIFDRRVAVETAKEEYYANKMVVGEVC